MENKSAKILLDVPVDDGVLGFDNYRDALINIIKGSDPHFTIGIFGGWGTGKTTLMRMMKKGLDETDEITVWFNPWQYEKETHLLIPLLQTINLELETNYREIVGEDTLKKITSLLKKVGKSVKPELTIGIAKVELNSEKLFEEEKEDLTSLYFELNQELKNVINKIKKKGKNKIVAFIDDLDRCLPDKALQVLESIKGFLDIDGYVFVLGLSRDIIEKCVDNKYGKESGITGNQYIRKMIQLPFALPDLRETETKEYVDRLKEELKGSEVQKYIEDYIDIIVGGMEANPREIKRFINNFVLANRISQKETEPDRLLAILIIQFRWETFYRDLAKYKKAFLEQVGVIVQSAEVLKNEESRKTAKKAWNFFDLIEGHLKDEQLRNFLEGAGKILFEIQDLDPYIHFSKSVVLEKEVKREWSKRELIELLKAGKIDEFNRVRSFPHIDLSFNDLSGLNLSRIDLSGADLKGTRFREANLSVADLSGANLTYASLRGVILSEANLRAAYLSGADMWGANLRNIGIDENTVFAMTIVQDVKNLSSKIRELLYIQRAHGFERATSKWLLERRKSEGKTESDSQIGT